MKKKHLVYFLIIFLLLTKTSYADQLSFGSVGHNQRFTMVPGDIKKVKLSFFNYGKTPLVVDLKNSGSDEIITSINPRYFLLESDKKVVNPMGEEEWVVLGENYAKCVPVQVIIKVPDNISEITKNFHKIKIVATASSEDTNFGGTKERMKSVHEYSFAITVPGNINARTEEEYEETLEEFYQEVQRESYESNDTGNSWNIEVKENDEEESNIEERRELPTGFFSLGGEEDESGILYYIIILAIVSLIIYILYRKRR